MFNRIFWRRSFWFAALLFTICLAPAVATGAEANSRQAPTTTAVEPPADDGVDDRFTRPPDEVTLPELPSDPVEALISAVNAHSESLGFAVDHRDAIEDSGMSDEYAGRVALLMQAVLACPPILESTDPQVAEDRLECAAAVNDAAAGVMQAKEEPFSGDIQAWPSLYIDGDGRGDFYVHDYSVLIDRGGNDRYDNNAGANLLDIQYGPKGSVAPQHGKAVGCEHAQTLPPVPATIPPPQDCIAGRQVVFIDQKSDSRPSDDVYGVFKKPRKVDHNPLPPPLHRRVDGDCTNDPVIRRVVLQGAGFQGNGLLIDEGGNDRYRAKTASQGAGHIGGIGVLRDLGGGKDDYLAIRSSQGFALVAGVAGLGLLQDDGGNDRYHTYMPRPLDPTAGNQEPGGGGVVDDLNNCDRIPRMVQGAAIGFGVSGGTGHLLDEDGQDVYIGEPPTSQLFLPPVVDFRHSSQGFGCDGGIGILTDEGRDHDEYRRGPEGRKDGASISDTQIECGFFPAPGQGIFRDDGR
jgi:hypothetical protein